jgi:hypothetical protein
LRGNAVGLEDERKSGRADTERAHSLQNIAAAGAAACRHCEELVQFPGITRIHGTFLLTNIGPNNSDDTAGGESTIHDDRTLSKLITVEAARVATLRE